MRCVLSCAESLKLLQHVFGIYLFCLAQAEMRVIELRYIRVRLEQLVRVKVFNIFLLCISKWTRARFSFVKSFRRRRCARRPFAYKHFLSDFVVLLHGVSYTYEYMYIVCVCVWKTRTYRIRCICCA